MNVSHRILAGGLLALLTSTTVVAMAQTTGVSGQEAPTVVSVQPMSRHSYCANLTQAEWERRFPLEHHDQVTHLERNHGYHQFRSVVRDIEIDEDGILTAEHYVDSDHDTRGFCSAAEFTFFDHNGQEIGKETFERNCAAAESNRFLSENERVLRRKLNRQMLCNMANMQVRTVGFELKE